MSPRKAVPKRLMEQLDDPEAARLITELLEDISGLATKMGSAAPVIDALSASFTLVRDANARSEFDEVRRLLVSYLESLDGGDIERTAGAKAVFEASPEVFTPEIVVLVDALKKKGGPTRG